MKRTIPFADFVPLQKHSRKGYPSVQAGPAGTMTRSVTTSCTATTIGSSNVRAGVATPADACAKDGPHLLWKRVKRCFFVVPPNICRHEPSDVWEAYDMDRAGCRMCGALHLCGTGCCEPIENEQGHLICKLTGFCVQMQA